MCKGSYIWKINLILFMESRYFKRDISWLSFNYRVLLEAEDDTCLLYTSDAADD